MFLSQFQLHQLSLYPHEWFLPFQPWWLHCSYCICRQIGSNCQDNLPPVSILSPYLTLPKQMTLHLCWNRAYYDPWEKHTLCSSVYCRMGISFLSPLHVSIVEQVQYNIGLPMLFVFWNSVLEESLHNDYSRVKQLVLWERGEWKRSYSSLSIRAIADIGSTGNLLRDALIFSMDLNSWQIDAAIAIRS